MNKRLLACAAVGMSALMFASCATTKADSSASGGGGGAGGSITVGTTDKVTALDPAGQYDNGSFFVITQAFPFLMSSVPGSKDPAPAPDIATSAKFTDPTTFTVELKRGLKFVNGHDLTASDVKFSFDRMLKINDPNGPASLLANLDSVEGDGTTVKFKLKQPNDQTFPGVLTTPAAPIVDEQVFPADKLLSDDEIVKAHPFAGQYDITSYSLNQLISFKANPNYDGALGKAKTGTVNLKYYADANNLKLDVQQGNVDVAYRQLSATDISSLKGNANLAVHEGTGGETRYVVFNMDTMPYGAKAPEADPKKAQAVRQAMANLIDRQAIATNVFKDTYAPLYSVVPTGMNGATTPLKTMYGDGNGKPSLDKAKQVLSDAGVTGPVTINLQYAVGHYGPSSGDEYAAIKQQLEQGGLFKVNLQSTEWVQYSKDRTKDVYPVYQLGWFPDYSDADNYLTPFFTKDNFLVNHFDDADVQKLIEQEVTEGDKAKRDKLIGEVQEQLATKLSILPLLQGKTIVVSSKKINGVDDTLGASYLFHLGSLSK